MAQTDIRVGSLLPAYSGQMLDDAGNPVNLTGATVQLRMRTRAGVQVFARTATVTDAVNGLVSYAWQAGDTATAGYYLLDWVLSFAGLPLTVPSKGSDILVVSP